MRFRGPYRIERCKKTIEVNEEMENVIKLNENIQYLRSSLGDGDFGDVMVVGGGISGIQASLDLGNAGFRVYLVEKAPSIGGHMAQLDKTFPTNDCSM
jgi:heterodisulfide reductase subunit A